MQAGSLSALPTYASVRLAEARREVLASGRHLFDFGVGDPKEPTPSFIRDALLASVPLASAYPDPIGGPELRRAIGGYLARRFHVEVDPEREVIVTSGSHEAIAQLAVVFRHLLAERKGVLYGEPGYAMHAASAVIQGMRPIGIPLSAAHGFILRPEDIGVERAAAAGVLWWNYPHNPTGATATRADVERIVDFARAHDLIVCADECYIDLGPAERVPSVLQVARKGVLALHSLSKRSGVPGYRSAFVTGDPELIAAYRQLRPFLSVGSPAFVEAAAAAAWSDDAHVRERWQTFELKRAILTRTFDALGLRYSGDGAIYVWLEAPPDMTATSYAERLRRAGIVVAPESWFGTGDRHMRVALTPLVEECRAAADVWRTVV